jgi:hypothetical protein
MVDGQIVDATKMRKKPAKKARRTPTRSGK